MTKFFEAVFAEFFIPARLPWKVYFLFWQHRWKV